MNRGSDCIWKRKEYRYLLLHQDSTNTSACLSCAAAGPKALPFQPHWSIIHPAGIFTPIFCQLIVRYPGIFLLQGFQFSFGTMGFIKKLPAFPLPSGRAACSHEISIITFRTTESVNAGYFSSSWRDGSIILTYNVLFTKSETDIGDKSRLVFPGV